MHHRFPCAVFASAAVTLGLFLLMNELVSFSSQREQQARAPSDVFFARLPPEPPPPPQPPVQAFDALKAPVEVLPNAVPVDRIQSLPVPPGAPVPHPGPPNATLDEPGAPDGPLVAIVRVEPAYPASAAARDLEGYVIVRYDVAADGRVRNVTVVESSHRLFEASAIAAAKRFRFKPRVVDGVARESQGLQNRFTYRMERG